MNDERPNILVNLPSGFFRAPALCATFERLDALGRARKTSHDTAGQLAGDLRDAHYVLMWSWPKLTDELLDQAPTLRMAAHLDLAQSAAATALRRGLPVSVTRSAFSPAVAEMALTLMLGVLRRTSDHHAAMRGGHERWVTRFPDGIDPLERQLTGQPVGIIGFGQIGRRLAELLAPFRVELRVFDPFVPHEFVHTRGATKTDLPDLLRKSIVTVLCAAANSGSDKLLGREQIFAMPRDAVLVNVSRAALVDTDALVERLNDGHFSTAIDVFDREPLPLDHPLRQAAGAYLTPHRAGGVMESAVRIVGWLIDDIEAHIQGRALTYALTERMVASLDA